MKTTKTNLSRKAWRFAPVVALCCFPLLLQAQQNEPTPVIKADSFAPPELLQGPLHKVDEQVSIMGGFPRFTIRSPYGTWQADGREMLENRIAELPALKEIEAISKTEAFTTAAKEALASPVKMVGQLIEKPGESLGNIASGIGLIAGRIGYMASAGVERAGDRASGNLTEQKSILKPPGIGEGIAEPRTFTGDPLGYNAKRREWAQQLKVDPYTNNALLSEKLNDLAAASFVGSFPVNLTVGMIAAPLSYGVEFNDAGRLEAYQYPAIDVEKNNIARLERMGIRDLPVRKLLRNSYFTPTLQTALVLALESLNVPARIDVVEFASRAGSDIEARYVINSVAMLSKHAKAGSLITGVKAAGNVLAATSADGKLIIPVPMDWIDWVKPVEDFSRRTDLMGTERLILISGMATQKAKQELTKSGWVVLDKLSLTR